MRTLLKTTIYSKMYSLNKIHLISHKIIYSRERGHLLTCNTCCLPLEHFNPYVRNKMRKIKVGKHAILSTACWVMEYK